MFGFSKKRVYLDWAAGAPVRPLARRAFVDTLASFGNPSAPYEEGREAKRFLEEARLTVARLAGTKPDGVIFTSGATEANALALVGHVRARMQKGTDPARMQVLYSPGAHASILGAIATLRERGVRVEPYQLKDGAIDIAALAALVTDDTVLVTMDAVCGETGTRFDSRGVQSALRKVRPGIALHVDASQLPLVESFELTRLSADLVTLDAQKVGGVRGVGALVRTHQVELAPLMQGGGQEFGLRSGTESPALAKAFAVALTGAARERAQFLARAVAMREELRATLTSLPHVVVNEGKEQAPHILNVSCLGRDTDYLVALLDAAGFSVSTRSACETDAAGSRAVLALTSDDARAIATLRISFGYQTTWRDLRRFGATCTRELQFLDENLNETHH